MSLLTVVVSKFFLFVSLRYLLQFKHRVNIIAVPPVVDLAVRRGNELIPDIGVELGSTKRDEASCQCVHGSSDMARHTDLVPGPAITLKPSGEASLPLLEFAWRHHFERLWMHINLEMEVANKASAEQDMSSFISDASMIAAGRLADLLE